MKKIFFILLLVVSSMTLFGCQSTEDPAGPGVTVSHENGRYRGVYIDRDGVEVVVQFNLVDNVVTAINFRALNYRGENYLTSDDPDIVGMRGQYQEAIDYLIDKDIREALVDLYNPGEMGISDFDLYTGASINSNKIVSAIRDALNRGVYSY